MPLELVYSDIWGPAPVQSKSGCRYYICFVDAYTRYTSIYLLENRSQALHAFQLYKALLENLTGHKIKALQTDNGREYLSNAFKTFLQKNGIYHRLTCPYDHPQNGKVERKHRHITETGLTLLATASLPTSFWDEAFTSAAYLINRLPSLTTNSKSPYELLFHHKPDYSSLRVFGCACYPNLRPYNNNKLEYRSQLCTFIGYAPNHKGYKSLAPSEKIYISSNVVFDELTFPYKQLTHSTASSSTHAIHTSTSVPSIPIIPALPSISAPPIQSPSPSTANSANLPSDTTSPVPLSATDNSASVLVVSDHPVQVAASSSQPTGEAVVQNAHNMQARAKSGIFKPKIRLYATEIKTSSPNLQNQEPTSVTKALQCPHWKAAMCEEYEALLRTNTWTLVSPPSNIQPIRCKWVFRIKRNPNGSIQKYKARLVAKGFHQKEGVDFGEIFSLVVKPATIRLILSLALSKGWTIHQFDFNNAFLNGDLTEEVYMKQPEGFSTSSHLVCKLNKSLYGLKLAPRAWFSKLSSALHKFGFQNSAMILPCSPDSILLPYTYWYMSMIF